MIKTKNFNIYKKMFAVILLIITLFGTVQPVFALSGSGNANWVGGQFATFMWTTDNADTEYGILARRLINVSTNERLTVFCVEHGVDFDTGVISNGDYYVPTNPTIKRACKVAYFGWYSKHPDYVIDGGINADSMINLKKDYVFTQQMVWETLGQSSARFVDSSLQNEFVSFKNNINNQIANMEKRPSFDATTITVDAGETQTITDSNNVLSQYNSIDKTVDGIRFQHNKGENTLTITVDENCLLENYRISDATMKSWGCIKDETRETDTNIYFEFKNGQQKQMMAMSYNDPVTMAFSLKINPLGNLELTKLNNNGDLVDGTVFTVNGPGYNGDVEVRNGRITLEKIKKGSYTIREKSVGTGYLLNTETYKVEVKPSQTATQAIVNSEPTGELSLTKIDIDTGNSKRVDGTVHHGDASIEGAVYKLYADEDIYNVQRTVKYFSKNDEIGTYTFNKNGVATAKITNTSTKANIEAKGDKIVGLPMGNYSSDWIYKRYQCV